MSTVNAHGRFELLLTLGLVTIVAAGIVGAAVLRSESLGLVAGTGYAFIWAEQIALVFAKCMGGRLIQAGAHGMSCFIFVFAGFTAALQKCEYGGSNCSGTGEVQAYPELAWTIASVAIAVALVISAVNYAKRDELQYT